MKKIFSKYYLVLAMFAWVLYSLYTHDVLAVTISCFGVLLSWMLVQYDTMLNHTLNSAQMLVVANNKLLAVIKYYQSLEDDGK